MDCLVNKPTSQIIAANEYFQKHSPSIGVGGASAAAALASWLAGWLADLLAEMHRVADGGLHPNLN